MEKAMFGIGPVELVIVALMTCFGIAVLVAVWKAISRNGKS